MEMTLRRVKLEIVLLLILVGVSNESEERS